MLEVNNRINTAEKEICEFLEDTVIATTQMRQGGKKVQEKMSRVLVTCEKTSSNLNM